MIAGLVIAMVCTTTYVDLPQVCEAVTSALYPAASETENVCITLEIMETLWDEKPDGPAAPLRCREAAWYVLALGHATQGARPWAQLVMREIFASMEMRGNTLRPRGSIPAAIDVKQGASAPVYELDISASAYVLIALKTHLAFTSPDNRAHLLEEFRDHVYAAGDLLANWTLGGSDEIAPSYVAEFGHDGVTPAMYFEFWMGLEAARKILESVGKTPPVHWTERQDQLMTRIKLQLINRGKPVTLDWNLAQWFQRISGWVPGEIGAYIANEDGIPAPYGFAWDIEEQQRILSEKDFQNDPLRAAQCFVALLEHAGARTPSLDPTP